MNQIEYSKSNFADPKSYSQTDSQNGQWVPLLEYAFQTGSSVSTIRRHIKSDKLKHRSENGRYQIWLEGKVNPSAQLIGSTAQGARVLVTDPLQLGEHIKNSLPSYVMESQTNSGFSFENSNETQRLSLELERARTEIAELKTLIAYYESALK